MAAGAPVAPRTFATIDVGTNTTLLLVARVEASGDVTVLENAAEITRLGRGIGAGGALGPEGIARTLEVLRRYAALAREHGARIAAIGTEALRRAPNGGDFLGPAAEILGGPVEVIEGAREAALTFRATVESFPDEASAGALVVVDLGGGSTEIVVAERGAVVWSRSLPLGSVRLTERHVRHDPAAPDELAALAREVDGALAAVPWPARATVVGVAGTVTTLAAMALRLEAYDAGRVHGYALGLAELDAEIARLEASTQAERERFVGLDPRRADVILAGSVLLRRIAQAAGASAVRVSDRGIRWGLLYELRARG
ncbi:MAG TPA: Ppx/GppA phosphatase family protein [Polyangia bacterium]|nr:Ppx/GppA phosphatase family protein [Polyangia bacterium]